MAGLKTVIPVALTDNTLPIIRDDKILTAGSLMLIDPLHSADPLPAGAPASGARIPNLAWKEAATVLGSGDATTLSSTFTIDAGVPASEAFVERSGKGGVHGIVSQTTNTTNNHGMHIDAPAALNAYLYANMGHAYYFSLWSQVTRIPSGAGAATSQSEVSDSASIAGRMLHRFYDTNTAFNDQVGGAPWSTLGNRTAPAAMGTVTSFRNRAEQGYNASTNAGGFKGYPAIWGKTLGYNNLQAAIHPSWILYRYYAEDLTVSGRTYAQVDTIDFALYQAAFATGGKFAGDTWTTPAI